MPDIKLGSLFDGIGVFPLAASRCGIRPVWASEIEKAPISITKRHFPDMAHLGDITKVDGGKIPPVHIITFGSPCQNLSLIGNRSGLAGAKSSLFYQAFRIIQEMRDATSDETFVRLTGEEGYSLVLIQTTGDVTDENVQAIQNSVDQTYSFQDKRDERTTGTYMAFVFCVYAFLAIIALVTVMNIVNSISMSVSARMKQYGAMRAVGMDERQMTKMIACEAFTYAVLGCVVGCAIGLPLSKSLYDFLIAGHFPSAVWQFPIISLGVILLFVSIAAIAAVYAPAKRIRNMSITATINEL